MFSQSTMGQFSYSKVTRLGDDPERKTCLNRKIVCNNCSILAYDDASGMKFEKE